MQITEQQQDGANVLVLDGRFDFGARKTFKDSIDRLQSGGCRHVVLNLERVTFVDSSALGLLVIAHQNLKLKQAQLSLVNPQAYVKQVLDLANVPKMIPVHSTLDEALAMKAGLAKVVQ